MAKTIDLEVPHEHDLEEARARMEALGDYFKNKANAVVTWNGDTARFVAKYMMINIDATIEIEDDRVFLEGPDPGRLLRKKAIGYLQGKLEKYLDPNTPVDKLPRS